MSRLTIAALACAFAAVAIAGFHQRSSSAAAAAASDGKAIYAAKCAACHQANGAGGGPYPPLAGNADVTAGDTANLILTVLNGRSGPIQVGGKTYSGTMPAWKDQLSVDEVAAVLTYVRSAWTNKAAAVTADQVAAARNPTALSGAGIYAVKCASCHQPGGQGSAAYPPLNQNPHVAAGDPKEMIATIVNGRSGPLTVNGTTYNGKMPTWKGQLSNADIAAVATFVRSAWSNRASAVTEQQVAAAGASVLNTVGASIYSKNCAVCHGANGQGGGHGNFPALAGDALVNKADAAGMIAVVQHGRSMMPAWQGQLSPGDIAAVATFVRSAWGNKGSPVTEQDVSAVK
ncbi:MAG: c-type cytochrome [Candidatus Eremiobacteraeota bacterium]|nr:c-type cytochrome [Candidatus Eremiobacteraeota bacterium]